MNDRVVRGALTAFVSCGAIALEGCSTSGLRVLHPAGPIALSERNLISATIGLMLVVVVPVLVMTVWFAWRYRASNLQATYAPEWDESPRLSLTFWLIPGIIVIILGWLAWISTHKLSPYQPIDGGIKPLTVEVIALDWKWLFIYPEQDIASVNELTLPVGRPIRFDITSDTVMSSFFIPRLGGQVYAMAGMETKLNLLANRPGTYFGENTQYSGRGFPYQFFRAVALPQDGFEAWVKHVKVLGRPLDGPKYAKLAKPSVRNPVVFYSSVKPHLFGDVVDSYADSGTSVGSSAGYGP